MNSLVEIFFIGLGYGGMLVFGSALGTTLAIGGKKKTSFLFLLAFFASLSGIMIGSFMK